VTAPRTAPSDAHGVRIETKRLVLTIPDVDAAPRLLAFAVDNKEHLGRWEPPPVDGYFTETYWRRRIEKNHEERAADQSLRLCVLRRDDEDGPVVGHVNYSNIVRGAFLACHLGYSIDRRAQGKGLMRESVAGANAYVFETLRLHRIMANYIPTNERSGRLLRSLGFAVEGYARDYLFIHDGWKDHILTALVRS
jgi:ribosomal-protein-alanine N-acetyltransferase